MRSPRPTPTCWRGGISDTMAAPLTRKEPTMTQTNQPSRRNLIAAGALGAVALAAVPTMAAESIEGVVKSGKINHSVCKWCYGKIPLAEFLPAIKKMGLKAIDLIEPK